MSDDTSRLSALVVSWAERCDQGRPASPEELCGDCPELLSALRQRLEAVLAMGNMLATTTPPMPGFQSTGIGSTIDSALPSASDTAGASSAAGHRYQVLRFHAQGGLGEVCRARDAELGREVALKRIQPRYADHVQSRHRFQREAEITARLEHPGIVPVYGLVRDAAGRPAYAMRFIEGKSMADAIELLHASRAGLDYSGLPFRQLLQKFVTVCNTLAYAHSKGVIHRDVKPHNVMLGQFGETLVVDWGLAKRLGEQMQEPDHEAASGANAPESELRTEAGRVLGTLAYASPEQVAGESDKVGPASDVYSLGATLYHLLTGRAPLARLDVAEALQAVRQRRFPKPRLVKTDVPAALEAICLKAMALQPRDRFANALDLANEVEQWLADEAVACHAEPLTARAGRWARKHRTLVTSAAALLVTAIVALGTGLAAVERERQATALERDHKDDALSALGVEQSRTQAALTNERHARAHAMTALRKLTDEVVEQQLFRRATLSAEDRRFLREVQRLYEDFASLPGDQGEQGAIQAEGHFRVARMRHGLGELDEAEESCQKALAIRERLAADSPANAELRRELAKTHNNLGLIHDDKKRPQEAESAFTAALRIQTQLRTDYPDRHELWEDLGGIHANLGVLYRTTQRWKEAHTAFAQALAVQQQLVDDCPTRVDYRRYLGTYHSNLGALYHETFRWPDAEKAYVTAVDVFKQLCSEFPDRIEIRHDLGNRYYNLGVLYRAMRKFKEAELAFNETLAIQRYLAYVPARREYHLDLAQTYADLSVLYRMTNRPKEAEAATASAKAIQQQLNYEQIGQPRGPE